MPPIPRATACKAGHDLTIPGATRVYNRGPGKGYGRRCQQCEADKRVAAAKAREQAKREEEARLDAEEDGVDLEDGGTESARNSPFATTKRQLEQEWGVRYAGWTLQQHQAHNVAMYRVLGWPDEGPVRVGFNHPVRPRR